eukprot:TRINITY_DN29288_c0_g1_i1.p1 TRINITY_DN29288_c0_g1~~TRINITY_DN29288_c0_g1_i1.p1  ORF type:complete len:481 (+),score=46.50 TRINITY_DN29288_c0_g1_i1:56-1498(+)
MDLDIDRCAHDASTEVEWDTNKAIVERLDGDLRYGFNTRLLGAWTKQPSDCCAGTALAACINSLRGRTRDSEDCMSLFDACVLLADVVKAQAEDMAQGLEKRLGCPLTLILETVRAELQHQEGKDLRVAKKAQLRSCLTSVVERGGEGSLGVLHELWLAHQHEKVEHEPEHATLMPTDGARLSAQDLFAKVCCPACGQNSWDEGKRQRSITGFCDTCGRLRAETCACGRNICVQCLFPGKCNDEGNFVAPGRDETSKFYCGRLCSNLSGSNGRCGPNNGPQCAACERFQQRPDVMALVEDDLLAWGAVWDWSNAVEELLEWMLKLKADEQLRHSSKPCTLQIGNWGLIAVADNLPDIRISCYIGLPNGPHEVELPLSREDTSDVVTSQWEKVKHVIDSADSVLLFHLTNHYCAIYAWREHVERREVLTNRSGQRPNAWMEWEECRKIMIKWSGYKILKLTLQSIENRRADCALAEEGCPT